MKKILFSVAAFSVVLLIFSFADEHYNKPAPDIAIVNQVHGLYLFVDSKPASQYDFLGTVTETRKQARRLTSDQYQAVRDMLIIEVKQKYPAANGIILNLHDGGFDMADAIQLK